MIQRFDLTTENSPPTTDPSAAGNARANKDASGLPPKAASLAPIRSDHSYSLGDFQRRTGLGRNGLRSARNKGLLIRKCGRNRYVLGADWHEFLRNQPTSDDWTSPLSTDSLLQDFPHGSPH